MNDMENKMKDLNKTNDVTAQMDPQDMESNKVMAVLCYFGLLWLIPFFMKKAESPFVRFHLNQGLIVLILEIVITIVSNIFYFIPAISFVGSIISGVGGLLVLVIAIMGIVNAATGKAKELPLVGGMLHVIK